MQHNIFNVISRCRPVNRRTKDGAGESGRSLKPSPTPFCWKTKLEGIRKYSFHGFKICIRLWRTSRYDFQPILDCFTDAIKLFVTMKWRAPTLGWNLRGRRSWRGAEWQKLDIQKVSRKVNLISVRRAIIGQQFFSSRISFSFPPPLPRFSSAPSPRLRCRGAARPEVAQTRQGSYLLEERVLRVTAGCSLFLDYCYAGGWRTGRREEDGEGGRRRKNGRVCVWGEREKKRESEGNEMDGGGKRESFPVKTSRIVLTTQQNSDCFVGIVIRCSWPWRLSINFPLSFAASSFSSVFSSFYFIFIYENNC